MRLPHTSYGRSPARGSAVGRLGFTAAFSAERNRACVQAARAAQGASGNRGATLPRRAVRRPKRSFPSPIERESFPGNGPVVDPAQGLTSWSIKAWPREGRKKATG